MSTRQELEEEKIKLINKMFDCAEAPIKEWVAKCLNIQVKELFPDYKQDIDNIFVERDGEYFHMYLSNSANCPSFSITEKDDDSVKKAASLLYDAVNIVFTSFSKVTDNEEIKLMAPMFEEKTMSFRLTYHNKYKMELFNCEQQLAAISAQLKRLVDPKKIVESGKEKANELKEQLLNMQRSTLLHYNSIDKKLMEETEEKLLDLNKKAEQFPKLYMVLEKNSGLNIDSIGSRLPEIGTRFQDPDEENLIDKLKNECE